MGALTFRVADKNDYESIKEIENQSFGGNLVKEEYDLIFARGWGIIFVAEVNAEIVGYQVVLFKEYNDEIEQELYPAIKRSIESGVSTFHDDVRFDSNKFVYFHLLGIKEGHRKQGIGKKLLRYSYENLPEEHKGKLIKSIFRLNNVNSVKACWEVLGLCGVGLKVDPPDVFNCLETSMYAESGRAKERLSDAEVFSLPVMKGNVPNVSDFLFPILSGDEDDLLVENPGIVEKLDDVFSQGYIIDGVYRDLNYSSNGISYYLCRK